MKTFITLTISTLLALTSFAAFADHSEFASERFIKVHRDHKSHVYHHNKRHGKNRHHKRKRHHNQEVLRLDIPVYLDGSDKLKLRRLINRHYNISTRNYDLKKVVIHNPYSKGRVRLGVGGYSTGRVYLDRGKNHIVAPVQSSNGYWTLRLKNVYTDYIRVVLTPKNYYAHQGRARHHNNSWDYSDYGQDYRHKGHRPYKRDHKHKRSHY